MTYFSQIHLSLILLIVPLFHWVFFKRQNLKLNLNFTYSVFGWILLSLYPYLKDFLQEKLILLEGFALGLVLGSSWLVLLNKWLRNPELKKVQDRVFAKFPFLIGFVMMTIVQFASSRVGLAVFWLLHGLILPLVIKGIMGNTKKSLLAFFVILSPAIMFYVGNVSITKLEASFIYSLLSIAFILFYFAMSKVEFVNAKIS